MPFDLNADLSEAYQIIAEKLHFSRIENIIFLGISKKSIRKESNMNPIVEDVLIKLLKALLTDDRINDAKAHLVEFLTGLAAKTPTELDDYAVTLLEKAMGMPA